MSLVPPGRAERREPASSVAPVWLHMGAPCVLGSHRPSHPGDEAHHVGASSANLRSVKVIVVGCGRVGSAVALELDRTGWEVTAIDEKEDALQRLGEHWSGGFVVGHGMDTDVLREAGIEEADAVVVATNGDNTNLVIGQLAQKHFEIETTIVRVLDPARAKVYASLGLRTISPTSTAIDFLLDALRSSAERVEAPG
jgi:trk system potassium uptake protein TrkA